MGPGARDIVFRACLYRQFCLGTSLLLLFHFFLAKIHDPDTTTLQRVYCNTRCGNSGARLSCGTIERCTHYRVHIIKRDVRQQINFKNLPKPM